MRSSARDQSVASADGGESAAAYFREIMRHELLTASQEVTLAQQLQAGKAATMQLSAQASTTLSQLDRTAHELLAATGRQAERRLIECNLRLVVSVARHFVGRGLSLLDLIQEGNIGLQIGVDKFDWQRGFRISTYVHWWIRQSILRAVSQQSRTIRLPSHVVAFLAEANRAESALIIELGRQPTGDEVAGRLDVDLAQLSAARAVARQPLELDSPSRADSEDQRTLGDLVADVAAEQAGSAAAENADLSDTLHRSIADLAPAERQVLRLRFGLDGCDARTLVEAGNEMGVSGERVRQLEARALGKLRRMKSLRSELAEYVQTETYAADRDSQSPPVSNSSRSTSIGRSASLSGAPPSRFLRLQGRPNSGG